MRALVLVAFVGLAGCATPCPPVANTETIVTRFRCQEAGEFTVTFTHNPDVATIAESGYPTVSLPAAVAGSGYRYGGGGIELRGRGDEARLIRPGAGERVCLAQD